jgi:hypothetical protein
VIPLPIADPERENYLKTPWFWTHFGLPSSEVTLHKFDLSNCRVRYDLSFAVEARIRIEAQLLAVECRPAVHKYGQK